MLTGNYINLTNTRHSRNAAFTVKMQNSDKYVTKFHCMIKNVNMYTEYKQSLITIGLPIGSQKEFFQEWSYHPHMAWKTWTSNMLYYHPSFHRIAEGVLSRMIIPSSITLKTWASNMLYHHPSSHRIAEGVLSRMIIPSSMTLKTWTSDMLYYHLSSHRVAEGVLSSFKNDHTILYDLKEFNKQYVVASFFRI